MERLWELCQRGGQHGRVCLSETQDTWMMSVAAESQIEAGFSPYPDGPLCDVHGRVVADKALSCVIKGRQRMVKDDRADTALRRVNERLSDLLDLIFIQSPQLVT